ncbi:hypothetical protein V1525DRAFT_241230 [Lipomyces kononenkoae]|uniref:Uncharacterized protein n=1 Tax=Lipomyces kononenkoae TaxID=34357 RepID=A0ACC3SW37_LIPKO
MITSNNRVVLSKDMYIVRLLAFLANPSSLNWAYLTENGFRAIDTPFSHSCGRGLQRQDGQVAYCINGLHHGRFASVNENRSHRLCYHDARPLCPGHGEPPVKCIFTHPDGTLKPCLNHVALFLVRCTAQSTFDIMKSLVAIFDICTVF